MSHRILIVEDELDLRSTLEFKFKSEGYIVNAVSTGKDAMDSIARTKPDLILLDLMLPDMSGLDICKKVRNSKLHSHKHRQAIAEQRSSNHKHSSRSENHFIKSR